MHFCAETNQNLRTSTEQKQQQTFEVFLLSESFFFFAPATVACSRKTQQRIVDRCLLRSTGLELQQVLKTILSACWLVRPDLGSANIRVLSTWKHDAEQSAHNFDKGEDQTNVSLTDSYENVAPQKSVQLFFSFFHFRNNLIYLIESALASSLRTIHST